MIDIMIDEGVAGQVSSSLPDEKSIQATVEAACIEAGLSHVPSLCIRFSDDVTVQALNLEWRKKDAVTDILSFPMQEEGKFDVNQPLGDMIFATPFTIQESVRLALPATDHMLHLIVHGTLHLLGYDHINDDEAKAMHTHERSVMKKLGLHDPYPDELYKDEAHG